MNRNVLIAIAGLILAVLLLTLWSSRETTDVASSDKCKVGFIYIGPPGDHGWNYQHDVRRKAVEEAYGDKVETIFAFPEIISKSERRGNVFIKIKIEYCNKSKMKLGESVSTILINNSGEKD